MHALPEIRGLKYPDEFVVRHFFKTGLSERKGRVLELGCGTGNNLALYRAYGWDVTGIDYDPDALADADWNLEGEATLVQADLSKGLAPLDGGYDVVLVPNLLCYLRNEPAFLLMEATAEAMTPRGEVFVRTRLKDDYRYGRGQEVEPHGFILDTPETGEAGLFNLFYSVDGLVEFLCHTMGVLVPETLTVRFDNLQSGRRIDNNSDVVVWGKLSR